MMERQRPKELDPIAEFMNEVDETGDKLPTMEELACLPPKTDGD